MGFLWFVIVIMTIYGLIRSIDLYRNRNPLNSDELLQLAEKRQRNQALFEYQFSKNPKPVDPVKKKSYEESRGIYYL